MSAYAARKESLVNNDLWKNIEKSIEGAIARGEFSVCMTNTPNNDDLVAAMEQLKDYGYMIDYNRHCQTLTIHFH